MHRLSEPFDRARPTADRMGAPDLDHRRQSVRDQRRVARRDRQERAKVEMNDLYKTNHILSNQIWAVSHFIDHLRSLHAHKVLDRRLATVLFKDSVASWIDVFRRQGNSGKRPRLLR